jgi:outer membrane immunogenic protein
MSFQSNPTDSRSSLAPGLSDILPRPLHGGLGPIRDRRILGLLKKYSLVLVVCLVAATLALASRSTTAVAADMLMNAPGAPVYQWSGCYLGGNIGGGASGTNFTSMVDPGTHLVGGDAASVGADGSGSGDDSSFLGGGQAGCNLQSGFVVFGLEGEFDYFQSNPQFSNNTNTLGDGVTPFTVSQSLTTDFLATVRPRIGIAANRNLAYVTGGVAFTRASYTESYVDGAVPAGNGSASSGSKSLVGWTAGAGWDYALADHWILGFEYLFASFPTTSALGAITDAGGGANTAHGSADLVIQVARAGVNFKF